MTHRFGGRAESALAIRRLKCDGVWRFGSFGRHSSRMWEKAPVIVISIHRNTNLVNARPYRGAFEDVVSRNSLRRCVPARDRLSFLCSRGVFSSLVSSGAMLRRPSAYHHTPREEGCSSTAFGFPESFKRVTGATSLIAVPPV